MARANNIRPIEELHGKLHKDDAVYYRWRNGKQYAVRLDNPRKKFTEKEKAVRGHFGELSRRAAAIAKDPLQAAAYIADFEAQKDLEGGKKSIYHYILSRLTQEK